MDTMEIEKRIIRRVIKDALEAGYSLSVNDGEEVILYNSTNPDRIFKAMRSTDEDALIYMKDRRAIGWVHFIYGNDGFDVIHDYTTNLENVVDGANCLADKLEKA